MFQWLINLFSKREFDGYRPKERLIYPYFDGEKMVNADPMDLYCRLAEKAGDLDADLQIAYSPSKDRFKAREKMYERIRSIFDLKPHKEGGLTKGECEALLENFISWCNKLKKNSPLPQTSSTVTSTTTKESLEEGQATRSSSLYGSIDLGTSNDEQQFKLSPME